MIIIRKVVESFKNLQKKYFKANSDIANQLFVSLFIQDVEANLLPYDKEKLSATATPNAYTPQIIKYLNMREDDLLSTLRRFIHHGLLFQLLTHGSVYYIILKDDNNGKQFQFINSKNIWNFFGIKYYLSMEDVEKPSHFIRLTSNDLICISLSSTLKKDIKKFIKKLSYFSENHIMPAFARAELEAGTLDSKCDYSDFRDQRLKMFAKANISIGWNARGAFKDETLEYYQLVMFLRFKKFICQLREEIIESINRGLAKVFFDANEAPHIELSGISVAPDIEKTLNLLVNGKIKFNDVISLN